MEIWKNIDGYDGDYECSNLGRIRTNIAFKGHYSRIMSGGNLNGYLRVSLYKNGVQKGFLIHRLVALTFLPNKNNFSVVNHKNGIKSDNRVENLEWVTMSDNIKHAYENGLAKSGHNHANYGKINGDSKTAKIVLNLQTGIYYDCLKDAANSIGINYTSLSSKLTGKRGNNTNMIYV
jgi:hypothetical protein